MAIQIITPHTQPKQPKQLGTAGQHAGVHIMLQQAQKASERATARMIECLAARLAEISERRSGHA